MVAKGLYFKICDNIANADLNYGDHSSMIRKFVSDIKTLLEPDFIKLCKINESSILENKYLPRLVLMHIVDIIQIMNFFNKKCNSII